MKKKLVLLMLTLLCVLVLAGCGCEHQWAEADCVKPATCTLCGKTEGEPLGHVWMAATCDAPKTCENCGTTDGEPKGHSWVDATCEEAKHCETCNLKEGEPLGHKWQDATTEAPQTCEVCAATEGERIITDSRFTTADTAPLQGKWAMELMMDGEMMGLPDFEGEVSIYMILNFGNAGNLDFSVEVTENFIDAVTEYSIDATYAELAAEGLDKEEADAEFELATGMTIREYVTGAITAEYFNDLYSSLFEDLGLNGVYYVADGMLYTGANWNVTMEPTEYTLEGDTLFIQELADELGAEEGLTRIYAE